MQTFDPDRYPNLTKLDEKVRKLLSQPRAAKWDTARTEYEICRIHPVYWMEQYGWIKPGEEEIGASVDEDQVNSRGLVPFRLNPEQLQISDKICAHYTGDKFTRVQMLILKHRKAGISTLIAAYVYWHMRFLDNIDAFAIADLGKHTDNIVEMIKIYHENDKCGEGCETKKYRPPVARPMPKNKSGLRLANNSMLEQDSGESSNPGTSGTIRVCHMSENSKWRDPINAETSLLNSIPRKGYVFTIKESTAYGINKFAEDCDKAEGGKTAWEFIFLTWLDMPDCEDDVYEGETLELTQSEKELMAAYPQMTLGHIKFRRRQIEFLGSEDTFKQDFPLNSKEPFLLTGSNYFNTTLVQKRINQIKFYRDWKKNGIDAIQHRYPELMMAMKHHPRGLQAALNRLEDDCVMPQIVEVHEGVNGNVGLLRNPDGKLTSGAATCFRMPLRDRMYVVSVDVAEGKEQDESCIQVFDSYAREQVLEWHGDYDEEITASYAVHFAKIYGNAVIVPEMNNKCGGALLTYLKSSGYRNIYRRKTVKSGSVVKNEEGWDTKSAIKKDVCSEFKISFKNGDCLIHSLDLLKQMMYFTDAKGRLQAAQGHKDDLISAATINLKVISITPNLRSPQKGDNEILQCDAVPTRYGNVTTGIRENPVRRYM